MFCRLLRMGRSSDAIEEDRPASYSKASVVSVNSNTKTYRYVLPYAATCQGHPIPIWIAARYRPEPTGPAPFDARTIAHQVIVPFDQANDRVLGGSPEPYVNNPVRVSEVSERHRNPQKNKRGWDHLCRVLEAVESAQDEDFTKTVLRQVTIEIYRRLSEVRVAYPTPRRISLSGCMRLIDEYLAETSGGDRLLALSSALFAVIGRKFHLFSRVERASITASDASTGMLADLECSTEDGTIVLVVEVKDRILTVSQMMGKVANMREKHVSEIFFVAQQGVEDQEQVDSLIESEFVSGQNIYVMSLSRLAEVSLALLGEEGRREFLLGVGSQLDDHRSDIRHRRRWAELLASA